MRPTYTLLTLVRALIVPTIGCSSETPAPGGPALPAESTMVAELSDFAEPVPADGTLSFLETTTGEPSIALWVGTGAAGFGMDLSDERAGDLVAGRLVESTGVNDGILPTAEARMMRSSDCAAVVQPGSDLSPR